MNEESRYSVPLSHYSDDEISLLDLWRVLARQWKMIGAIAGLSVLGAVAYVLLATQVYEAQAIVKPPESKYVEALNISGISQISSADIFAKFIGNLKSNSLRQQFFAENPQFSSLQQQVADKSSQFLEDNMLNIKEGTKNEAGFVFVKLQGHDSKLVADWVNGLILLADKKTIDDFSAGIETNIANQKKDIENQLQIGRELAGQRRLDRIALLKDQIAIARASNIFERKLSGYSVVEDQSFGLTMDTLQGPLYMRGVKELVAEKEALEKRKNDEPFIAGFRDKQENLAQLDASLKQLQAARTLAHAATVDQPAIQSKSPVKPRRMRVLALSVVLGLMLGVVVAFLAKVAAQQRGLKGGPEK